MKLRIVMGCHSLNEEPAKSGADQAADVEDGQQDYCVDEGFEHTGLLWKQGW